MAAEEMGLTSRSTGSQPGFFSLEGVTLLGQFRKLSLSVYCVQVLVAQEGSRLSARV